MKIGCKLGVALIKDKWENYFRYFGQKYIKDQICTGEEEQLYSNNTCYKEEGKVKENLDRNSKKQAV